MIGEIKDLLNAIKVSILGTQSSRIDQVLDRSIKNIQSYSVQSPTKYTELIQGLLDSIDFDKSGDITSLSKILFQSVDMLSLMDSKRISKYLEYDNIVRYIPHCERALKVLCDNILSPDDITKRTLRVMCNYEDVDSNMTIYINRVKQIIKETKLEAIITDIIFNTLKYGDYFVEIVTKRNNPLDFYLVSENIDIINSTLEKEICNIPINLALDKNNVISTNLCIYENIDDFDSHILMESEGSNLGQSKDNNASEDNSNQRRFSSKYSDSDDKDVSNNDNNVLMKDVRLVCHNPKNVIKLQTKRFKLCLGYLVFPDISYTSSTQASSSGVNILNNIYMGNRLSSNLLNPYEQSSLDTLCNSLLNNLYKQLSNDKLKDTFTSDLKKDIKNALSNYLKDIEKGEDLRIRYVKPSLMVHWKIGNNENFPYGTSIFEKQIFDSKLLMSMKTAQTIKQLSSATDKRIIKVEMGLTRDVKTLIENIKESLRKRKISVDQFGSIDTIPSHVSTFEDIYIPVREGREFISIDHGKFGQDPSLDTEPMRFVRDNIVANLEVPPAFVGLEEHVGNRALLTTESNLFARTIIAYQNKLTPLLNDLIVKVYKLIYKNVPNQLNEITVTFPPPNIASYEHYISYIEQAIRICDALETLGIPKSYSKRKYLPDIDWDEIEHEYSQEKVKNELRQTTEPGLGGVGGVAGMSGIPAMGPSGGMVSGVGGVPPLI